MRRIVSILAVGVALFSVGCPPNETPENQLPTAGFSANETAGQAPFTVLFQDNSVPGSSAITSWSWMFGDGESSASQNPSHTYANAGNYTVALTVSTSVGSVTMTKTNYISVSDPQTPPTAAFAASPTTGDAPFLVLFTDQSTAGSSPITSWSWTFGDGESSTVRSPSHLYVESGIYTVALTVGNFIGTDTAEKIGHIEVTSPAVAPVAAFTSFPGNEGVVPFVLTFQDASIPGSSPIASWQWNIGGFLSSEQNPSVQFILPGLYDVQLLVTDENGLQDQLILASFVTARDIVSGPGRYLGMYIFAQDTDAQFLGFITANEFLPESIVNQFGVYGSEFSSTSIRNPFSDYGSQFATFSAYNPFTSSPPIIYSWNGESFDAQVFLTKSAILTPRIDPDFLISFLEAAK